MSRKKRVFVAPVLKSTKGRNGEVWYVEFSFRSAKSGQMIRKRISTPFTNTTSDAERKAVAKPIIEEISMKLNAGWNPEDDNSTVYIDHIDYHLTAKVYGRKKNSNRTLRKMTSEFIESRQGCKEKTIQTYVSRFRKLVAWADNNNLGEADITAVSDADMQAYFKYLSDVEHYDPTTLKSHKIMLRSLFIFVQKKYQLSHSPIQGIVIPMKNTDFSARPILQHDVNRLLDTI